MNTGAADKDTDSNVVHSCPLAWEARTSKATLSLLTPDQAMVLQYCSGHSCDFLATVLGADTLPFLWEKQFYFPLSSSLLHILEKGSIFVGQAVVNFDPQ
jgi:hypothetical protein